MRNRCVYSATRYGVPSTSPPRLGTIRLQWQGWLCKCESQHYLACSFSDILRYHFESFDTWKVLACHPGGKGEAWNFLSAVFLIISPSLNYPSCVELLVLSSAPSLLLISFQGNPKALDLSKCPTGLRGIRLWTTSTARNTIIASWFVTKQNHLLRRARGADKLLFFISSSCNRIKRKPQ